MADAYLSKPREVSAEQRLDLTSSSLLAWVNGLGGHAEVYEEGSLTVVDPEGDYADVNIGDWVVWFGGIAFDVVPDEDFQRRFDKVV